jgi:hypothetical protein
MKCEAKARQDCPACRPPQGQGLLEAQRYFKNFRLKTPGPILFLKIATIEAANAGQV